MRDAGQIGLVIGLLAVTVAGNLSASESRGEQFVNIAEEADVSDWLLDESSGRIFAAVRGNDDVVEFSPESGKEVRRWRVAQRPRQIVIKGHRLVVSADEVGLGLLCVINLQSNEIEGQIALGGKNPAGLCCSKADNPSVYVFCDTAPGSARIVQADIVGRRIQNRVPCDRWVVMEPFCAAMSADGRYLVTQGENVVQLLEVDETKGTLQSKFSRRNPFGPVAAGPASRFWVIGKTLLPPNLVHGEPNWTSLTGIRDFGGSPVAIHPTLDLVVHTGVDPVETYQPDFQPALIFETFSKASPPISVPLPTAENEKYKAWSYAFSSTLQFDARRNRVLFGLGNHAHVLDMSQLDLPSEPLLLLQAPSFVSGRIGQPIRIPLQPTNPALLPVTKYALDSELQGVAVDEEGTLVWTPTAADVGLHQVKITATAGESKDEVELEFRIVMPTVDLGAIAQQLVVDRAGHRALVAVRAPDQDNFDHSTAELLLVDLKDLRILARHDLGGKFVSMHLTDRAVYLAEHESPFFEVLKLDDLSPVQRVQLNHPVGGFGTLAPNRLIVGMVNHANRHDRSKEIAVYDEETLEKVDVAGLDAANTSFSRYSFSGEDSFSEADLVVPLDDGVYFAGLVLDPVDLRPQFLYRCEGIPGVYVNVSRSNDDQATPKAPGPWGRHVYHDGILAADDWVASWKSTSAGVLRRFPVAVRVRKSREDNPHGEMPIIDLTLEFRELTAGGLHKSVRLWKREQQNSHEDDSDTGTPMLGVGNETIAVAYLDRLLVTRVPEEQLADVARPLRFLPKQEPLKTTVGEQVSMALEATGGEGKKTFEMLADLPGLALDEDSGKLTVDTTATWEFAKSQLKSRWKERRVPPDRRILDEARAGYRSIFGEATEQFPVAVHVHLAVTDEKDQQAHLACELVMLGPSDEIERVIADMAEEREQANRPRPERQPTRLFGGGGQPFAQFAESVRLANRLSEQTDAMERGLAELEKDAKQLNTELDQLEETAAGAGRSIESTADQIATLEEASRRQDRYLQAMMIVLIVLLAVLVVMAGIVFFRLRRPGPIDRR